MAKQKKAGSPASAAADQFPIFAPAILASAKVSRGEDLHTLFIELADGRRLKYSRRLDGWRVTVRVWGELSSQMWFILADTDATDTIREFWSAAEEAAFTQSESQRDEQMKQFADLFTVKTSAD